MPLGGQDPVAGSRARVAQSVEHAVAAERKSIEVHEAAASMHDRTADELEHNASLVTDREQRQHFEARAQRERLRAEAARHRAAGARQRLAEEGH